MKSLLTPQILDDLYGWLAECAAKGGACPGNTEIARRYAFASVATAAKAVGRLEEQGRIGVLRGWTARQATIIATGKSTAPIPQAVRFARRPPASMSNRPILSAGPDIIGPKGQQCQWIEGKPTGDDRCKCRRKTAHGVSWCAAHLERIYLPPEVAEARYGPLPGVALTRRAAG